MSGPGRPKNAGLSLLELINTFKTMPITEVKAIAEDPKESVERVTAACRWLNAATREGGDDFDRVCDRTMGKPTQAMQITGAEGDILKVSHQFDTSGLTDDELAKFESIFARRVSGASPPSGN